MSKASSFLTPGSRRWYDSASRYLALLTAGITLVSTTAVLFVTKSDVGAVRDLVIACIGLLGLVISLLLEVLFRVTERARARERYGRLLEGVEEFPDLLAPFGGALEAGIQTLRHAKMREFREEVFAIMTHASARLEELAQGRLRRDGSDNTLVLERFQDTEKLLQGTTDEGDTAWWRANDGKQFLALNEMLIKDRAVRVERIWMLNKRPTDSVRALLDEHRSVGVHVYIVRADGRDLERRLLVNLTLMDRSFMQQDVLNREGHAVEYLYSENHSDIERAAGIFAQLKSRATEYTGAATIEAVFGTPERSQVDVASRADELG